MSRWHGLPFVDACRHPTSLNIPYRILPFSTRYHQNDPEWEAAKPAVCCQSWSILILRSMVRVLFLENNGKQWKISCKKHKNIIKKSTSKNRGPWTAVLGGSSCSDSEVVSPCWMAIRAVEEWALWCYVMLWYALCRDAFQSFPTRVYETCTAYKKQIKSKNDMASQHLTHWSHHISPGLHAPRLHLQSHF